MTFASRPLMPAQNGAAFSPTDAAQAVRSIERLVAQRRFDEAAAMALRALQFESQRRDVRLLLVRALLGACRYGEAADEALATLALFPNDVAARTLLRTSIGRLHLAVRGALTRVETGRAALAARGITEEVQTARHEPFGPVAVTELSIEDLELEATSDDEPAFLDGQP